MNDKNRIIMDEAKKIDEMQAAVQSILASASANGTVIVFSTPNNVENWFYSWWFHKTLEISDG